jgi:exopolysaccharide/PEP-CTERM locus tyrosine autokinase
MKHTPLRASASLLERAAEIYDFGAALRAPAFAEPQPAPEPEPEVRRAAAAAAPEPQAEAPAPAPAPRKVKRPIILSQPEPEVMLEAEPLAEPLADLQEEVQPLELTEADPFFGPEPDADFEPLAPSEARAAPAPRRRGEVDREALVAGGYILPDAAVTGLAEEFRIIKRQLLVNVSSGKVAEEKSRSILVCSARANEGKTFCALNLALSLAAEKDLEVLLVDGDFAKPEILSLLGLESGPGLVDAIADPQADVEEFVVRTDLGGLSVLPAGRQAKDVTELLSSERTRKVLAQLSRNHPRRVVIFDSPPALLASPASVLATHVGQVLMVVRADQTTEPDLKEAVGLLSGCDRISLMLNGTGLAAGGPRFGSYYGYGQ